MSTTLRPLIPLFAIAHREWSSFFRTPIGWIVMALFLMLAGVAVSLGAIEPGGPATLRPFFAVSNLIMIVVAPAISMRLYADEIRSGTLEPLMASPVSDWAAVIGKYLGAVAFLITLLAPTLVYVALLEILSSPDYGPIAAGYLGLILMGMLYLAVGLLASALTESQLVALLATLFVLMIVEFAATQGAAYIGPPWDRSLYAFSVRIRMADFAKGVIDTAHIVFFLAASFWFLVCSVVAVEFRRWR